jgi:O-antigen/teichoic acid export membrane protein
VKIRSVKVNFIFSLLNTGISLLFPLITLPYVTRMLGPESYGACEFAFSTALFFGIFAVLGANTYGTRECAKTRDDPERQWRLIRELLALLAVTTSVVCLVYYAVILLMSARFPHTSLLIVSGLLIPMATLGVDWFINGNEQYAFSATMNLGAKVLTLALMFLFVHSSQDAYIWVWIYVAANLLASLANIIFMFKQVKFTRAGSLHMMRHLKPMLLFFMANAASSIYMSLDTLMLGVMVGTEAVAYYQIGLKVKRAIGLVMGAAAGVIAARVSYYAGSEESAHDNSENTEILVSASVRFALVYSIYAAFAIGLFAKPIIYLFAGDAYDSAIMPMVIMMPAVLFISLTYVTSQELMMPFNLERWLSPTYAVAAAVDFLLNLFLIPRYGAFGAAVSTTIAEGLVLVLQVIVVKRSVGVRRFMRGCSRIVLPTALSVAVLFIVRGIMGATLPAAMVAIAASMVTLVVALLIAGEPLVRDTLLNLFSRMRGYRL